MNSAILQWATRHGVSYQAIEELRAIWGELPVHVPQATWNDNTEAYVQSVVRLEAPHKGVTLFRNNVGVLPNPETGVPVRYGLANDSKRLNETVKSGDLIGWRRVLITPEHVGSVIAQFMSRECKRPGWTYTGTERELAQRKWALAVIAGGGDASFVTGPGSL
jgi:hypothetical protein